MSAAIVAPVGLLHSSHCKSTSPCFPQDPNRAPASPTTRNLSGPAAFSMLACSQPRRCQCWRNCLVVTSVLSAGSHIRAWRRGSRRRCGKQRSQADVRSAQLWQVVRLTHTQQRTYEFRASASRMPRLGCVKREKLTMHVAVWQIKPRQRKGEQQALVRQCNQAHTHPRCTCGLARIRTPSLHQSISGARA